MSSYYFNSLLGIGVNVKLNPSLMNLFSEMLFQTKDIH